MSEATIEVDRRETRGKNANRRLRATGQLPAVVYGDGRESVAIQVERRQIEELLRKGGENTVFLLRLKGTEQSRHTMIRELQKDSVTGQMLHIDFQRINMERTIRVRVPIELHGKAFGVRNEDGILDFVTREVEIACLPGSIPAQIAVDVTELHVGQHVEARQLALPEGVELGEDPERVIVSVGHARLAVAAEEEEAELLEAEEAEPEVIGRGKAEAEPAAEEG